MRILILEDDIIRVSMFRNLFKHQRVDFCKTVTEAKEACLLNEYNVLLLDHDLDGKHWVDSAEKTTGYEFVNWLIENNSQIKSLCYIHSMNFVGANKMMKLMLNHGRDCIWIPFNLLELEV